MESFQFMNPGWEWRFYTDEDCLRWVADRCPRLLRAYQGYKTGIHRADFFRILLLYYEGGVYADIDMECLRPLDELLSRLPAGKSVYLPRDHPIHERIHFGGRAMWMNDFMIAAPGDPLIGEVLRWMMHSPPSSGSSANAVMETGPGIISAVIEMHGGVEQIPGLGVIPTPWVHPLPDMNCGFPEKHYYGLAIASREWLRWEPFVAHYWFHTWVAAADANMLTDYAEVLLSTRGEQVERLFQWELRDSAAEADFVMAAALAEFAEQGGTLELWIGPEPNRVVDRFLELLAVSGLQPRMCGRCWEQPGKPNPLGWRLEGLGAARGDTDEAITARTGLVFVSGFAAAPPLPEFDGLLLGPSAAEGEIIASGGGMTLSEVWTSRRTVPQVLHLFPSDERFAEDIAAHFAERGWETRQWTLEQLRKRLQEETLGSLQYGLQSPRSIEVAAGLLILHEQGGAVFEGDSQAAAAAAGPMHRPTLIVEPACWFFACEPRCPLLDGAFLHWLDARRHSRANASTVAPNKRGLAEHVGAEASLRDFLRIRFRTMHLTGRGRMMAARRLTAWSLVSSRRSAGPIENVQA